GGAHGQYIQRGENRCGSAAASQIFSTVQGAVYRDQSDPGQGGPGDPGRDRGGIPAAAGADVGEKPRGVKSRHAAMRSPQVSSTGIIITGAKGRMGQTLVACAERIPELKVVAQIDVGDDLGAVIEKGDVVIDFS